MGPGRWTGWISTGWWYSEPSGARMNGKHRKWTFQIECFSAKKELAKNIIRASSTMRLKLTTRYGFGSKIMKFNNFKRKTKKIIDFPLFSNVFVQNQWFFNQNHSVLSTLNTSFSKLRQYFLIICFLLKSSRSETFISDVFHSFFRRIAAINPKILHISRNPPCPSVTALILFVQLGQLDFLIVISRKIQKIWKQKFPQKI